MATATKEAAPPFRLSGSKTVPLTMELAKIHAGLPPSPVERELNPVRVKHLDQKAQDGYLIQFQWAIVECDGVQYRINGQHSANMLIGLNGKFPGGLYAHIDEYTVDDVNDMALLFRQFDDRTSSRTSTDVAGAYLRLVKALDPVPLNVAKRGAEGIAWEGQRVEGVPYGTGDDIYRMFNKPALHAFFLWLSSVLSDKAKELYRVPVVAAMYATFNANDAEARPFWLNVANGGEEGDDSPEATLDEWLRKEPKPGEDPLKPGQWYQGCIYAWNAHRRGVNIGSIRYDIKKGLTRANP